MRSVGLRAISPPEPAHASPVVFERTVRSASRSGALWGYVFGAAVASSAWTYTGIYRSAAQRERLAATFGDNKATIALFGPAPHLETVAGFTVFKVGMTLSIVGALWGVLTATRLLRGEEDAGRWDLLLAGGTGRRGAAFQAIAGMGLAALVLWSVTSVITVVAGVSSRVALPPGGSLFLALALTCPACMFLAVGALTSQVAPTRRRAAGYGAVVLGVSYGLRLVGDAGIGAHWLTWSSPLGWVEELAPLSANRAGALVPIAVVTVVLAAVAVVLAGRRDVGQSLVPDRSRAASRPALLGSSFGLGVRLVRPVAVSWLGAVAVVGLLFGLVAKAAGATISGSSVRDVFDRLGATGSGTGAYLGVTFLLLAVLAGFVAAGQIVAVNGEEQGGRLDHLLARPVSRTGWLTGRLCLAVLVVTSCGAVAGLATWCGATLQHAGVGAGDAVAAGVNAAVPGILLVGLGALLLGLWPRAADVGVYAVLVWSVLAEIVGGIGSDSRWLLDSSLFHRVGAAPATPPDWGADGVVVAVAIAAAVVGVAGFRRRDVAR